MKYISLCALLLFTATYSRACTVCGCSANNQYLGILPQFHRHFIGLQYQYRSFESTHEEHDETGAPLTSSESYHTTQLWGRWNVGRRFQFFAFLPYHYNVRKEAGVKSSVGGLGDVTLLANYNILINKNEESPWQHNLQAGGGIKLPTGAYDANAAKETDGLPNMQPGTSSWDFIINANYTLRRSALGINTDVSYTITTPNSNEYKYGNRFGAGISGFYWYQKKNVIVLPQLGLRYQYAGTDYDNYRYSIKNDMSGGTQWYAVAGVQSYYKRFGAQLMYHHPVAQHYAGGLVSAIAKVEGGLFLLF